VKRAGILLVLLVAEIALFTSISGNNFDAPGALLTYLRNYLTDLLAQTAPTLVVAFGMTVILMASGIDLSIGSSVALISCVLSSFPAGPNFWWTALPAGVAVGVAAGGLNGFLIARLDVPPIQIYCARKIAFALFPAAFAPMQVSGKSEEGNAVRHRWPGQNTYPHRARVACAAALCHYTRSASFSRLVRRLPGS